LYQLRENITFSSVCAMDCFLLCHM
jgi:hypothetical protein